MPPQAFPERALAVRVQLAAKLGDDLRRETLREFGDEQEPRLRQERSVAAVAKARVQKKRTELAVPGVVVGQEQGRRRGIQIKLARGVHLRAHVVVVPGLGEAYRGLDRADADDMIVGAVDQHEHEAFVGFFGRAGKRRERAPDARVEPIGVRGQGGQSRAGALGQRKQRLQVAPRDRSYVKHGERGPVSVKTVVTA